MRIRFAVLVAILLCSVSWGQNDSRTQNAPSDSNAPASTQSGGQSMPGMDMPGDAPKHEMSNMKMPMEGDKDADSAASTHVMNSMEGHMDMGPHMKMTALRPAKPGDAERAQKVAEAARKASEKYTDYQAALADGFQIFLPNVPQKMYHFTNRRYATEALMHFNPEHPTSLLYEKQGDGYKLIGVMYTAPKRFTEDDLDQRIPLSIAQWHEHVNFCIPPLGRMREMSQPHPQFGLNGSINTQEACDAAGGTFHPVVFNWMVHVYPFEKDMKAMWSVGRQHGDAD